MNTSDEQKLHNNILQSIRKLRLSAYEQFSKKVAKLSADTVVKNWMDKHVKPAVEGKTNKLKSIVGPLESENDMASIRDFIGWPSVESEKMAQDFGMLDHDFYDIVSTCPPRDTMIAQAIVNIEPARLDSLDYSLGKEKGLVDLGCGTGVVLRVLRMLDFTFPIEGFDKSEKLVELCNSYTLPNVIVRNGDVSNILFDRQYEAAVSIMLHHHVDELCKSFENLNHALVDCGTFSYTDKFSNHGIELNYSGVNSILLSSGHTGVKLRSQIFGEGVNTRPHPNQYDEHLRSFNDVSTMLRKTGFLAKNVMRIQPYIFQFQCKKIRLN